MVALFITEAIDLIFNAWAIPRPHAFDLACKKRGSMEVGLYNFVGSFVGVGDVAGQLRWMEALSICSETKWNRILIAWLDLHLAKIDGFCINSSTGAGFESTHPKSQILQAFAKHLRGKLPSPTRFLLDFANMDEPT